MKEKIWLRITVFLAITFAATYAYELLLLPRLIFNPNLAALSSLFVGAAMIFPALGVLLTRLVTKEGFRDARIAPNFRGRLRFYFIAWLAPAAATAVGGAAFFLAYPGSFDGSLSALSAQYGAVVGLLDVRLLAVLLLILSLFVAPVSNAALCFGEEWGWRGYLVPKLIEKMPVVPAMLISGVIWGLWHAPLTALGHNYGTAYRGFPWLGIAAMCGFCVAVGIVLSYVSLKTRSCLPAVVGHATINGFAAAPLLFAKPAYVDPFVGPAPTGYLGGCAFIALALTLLILMVRDSRRGALVAPPAEKRRKKTAETIESE